MSKTMEDTRKYLMERIQAHNDSGVPPLVLAEMGMQDIKWGHDRDLDAGLWYLILGEEFGEVGKAVLENDENLREELIQVAAVAIQWIEMLDRQA